MTWYIGRPGDVLEVLTPTPQLGWGAPYERVYQARTTVGGGRVVDYSPGGLRTFAANWAALTHTQLSQLERWYLQPGPYVLLDTTRTNHLTAGQSMVTSVEDVAVDATETLTVAALDRVRRLWWTLPATVTSGLLTWTDPHGLVGHPWPVDQPATVSARVYSTASATVHFGLRWLDASGVTVEDAAGDGVTTSTTWTSVSCSVATPPTGARYLLPRLVIDSGGDGAEIYVDQPMLTMATTAPTWVPGTGIPLVSWAELTDTYPWCGRHAVTATLLEVR